MTDSCATNEVEPIKVVVPEVERKDDLELTRFQKPQYLRQVVPFTPWSTFAVRGFSPFTERLPSLPLPALLRISQLDPAPAVPPQMPQQLLGLLTDQRERSSVQRTLGEDDVVV